MYWILEKLSNIFAVIFVSCTLYILFIVLPVRVYTEAKCLRKGYPEAKVTIGLEKYCLNMDGDVTRRNWTPCCWVVRVQLARLVGA